MNLLTTYVFLYTIALRMQTIEKLKQEDNNQLFLVCKENKTLIGQFSYVLLLQVFYVSRPLYIKK